MTTQKDDGILSHTNLNINCQDEGERVPITSKLARPYLGYTLSPENHKLKRTTMNKMYSKIRNDCRFKIMSHQEGFQSTEEKMTKCRHDGDL